MPNAYINMKTLIDFRSDTVTKPTAGMLEAMFKANVGDDVYGEDETVTKLEKQLAAMFGMEAGLFCPSGTMTNQIAIKCFTNPMEEVICDQTAHVYRYEGGGIAYNSLASVRLLYGNRGIITPEMISAEINDDNIHFPPSTLVVLENTVNKGGGKCYKLAEIKAIHELCTARGLKLHLDGARIFNALVANCEKPSDYAGLFDGISVCLSKGLGAPVGSVLLASKATIAKAKRIRKVMGGGMRQAGYLAAAGLYALQHHIDRLADDHKHAAMLADALQQCAFVKHVIAPETNIVLFDVVDSVSATAVVAAFKQVGILCNTTGPSTIRLVTHLDITPALINQSIALISAIKF